MRGKLIVLDGGDGAGKGTQTKLLIEKLQSRGFAVSSLDFPRYEESLFGGLCGRALKGEFGDFVALSPYLASLPYTLDRVGVRSELFRLLEYNVVVCNRYTPSNIAYQAAKLSGKMREKFVDFLTTAEYVELGLPMPSLVLYLYVPVRIAHVLVAQKNARGYLGKKRGARDQHEANQAYQERVMKTYLWLAKKNPGTWRVINCAPRGKILSREAIHQLILAEIEKL